MRPVSCFNLLRKNHNITPDVLMLVSLCQFLSSVFTVDLNFPALLTAHTLQNIGLIKDQFNEINLGGSTEHTPHTSHLTPEKMIADILPILLVTVSARSSVIVNWRVRPGLETDWQPVDHWRYSHPSSTSPAQRRSSQQDFGHLVKERFLYSHHSNF